MEWREEMVRKFFRRFDADEILKVRLPTRISEDFTAWAYEKSGGFSVYVVVIAWHTVCKKRRKEIANQAQREEVKDHYGRLCGVCTVRCVLRKSNVNLFIMNLEHISAL
jgi:hypothetical protein